MLIVLDTNALFDDPVMVRDASKKMLELLAPARAVLIFSPVVLGELNRKRNDEVEGLDATVKSRVKRLARLSGLTANALLAETQTMVDAAADRWSARWKEILSNDNVEVSDWPQAGSEMMARRELARRRPFMDKDPGTIGHRDTLIWLSVIELARDEPGEDIVLVTADKGFLDGEHLHPHLLDDLASIGASHSVRRLSSIHALVTELQKATETSGWEEWRESQVAEVLNDEIQKLGASDFAEHADDRHGGASAELLDVGLPYTGHDWMLTYASGPQGLEVDEAQFGAEELACTFEVDLQFSGFMDKFEWYGDDHPSVDLWDADWNDYTVSVEATRRLRVRAQFEIDDRSEMAYFDAFTEAEVIPEP